MSAGRLQTARLWLEPWDELHLDLHEIIDEGGDGFVALVEWVGRGRGSGAEVEMESFWMTEVRDGRFAVVHLYPTLEEARAAAREREAKRSE